MKKIIKTAHVAVVISSILTISVQAQTDKNTSREEQKTKAASIPDKIQTVAGELQFFDGVPIGNTNDLVYDYLNRARAVDVYLDNVGAV